MLSKRQKQIVESWSDENEGDKEPIRQKLRKSLADIPYLRKLPPMEAREIVRSAISNYAEMDNKSRLSDRDEEYANMNVSEQIVSEEMIVNERYARPFIINSISVLFNSVSESEFELGINEGIEDTAEWWQEYDVERIGA